MRHSRPLGNTEAERAVLSTVILEPARYSEVSAIIGASDYYHEGHRILHRTIGQLLAEERAVDVLTLATSLRETGMLDRVGGTPYLAQIIDATPSLANVADHARIVADFAERRRFAEGGEHLSNSARGDDPIENVRAQAKRLSEASSPPAPKIKLTSLEAALQEADEPLAWLWSERHLIAPGRATIVSGYGGSCKTWIVLVMALSIATGMPCLGTNPVKTGRAIVLEYETGGRRLRRRLRRLVQGYGLGDDLSRLEFAAQEDLGLWLTSPGAEEELVTMCTGAVLLVVDSLIQSSPGLRENDAEMAGPLHMLARVSARTGCAVVVIHHERKTSQDNAGSSAGQALRGHSSIHAACDAVWRLNKVDGGPVEMRATKVSDGRPPNGWDLSIVDTDGGGIVLEATDALDRRVMERPLTERIVELVTETPGLSGRELRVAAGGRRDAVYDALAVLQRSGAVVDRPGPRNSTTWWPAQEVAQ